MKHQALFSSKDKSKKKKIYVVSSAAILLGAFRVKIRTHKMITVTILKMEEISFSVE